MGLWIERGKGCRIAWSIAYISKDHRENMERLNEGIDELNILCLHFDVS